MANLSGKEIALTAWHVFHTALRKLLNMATQQRQKKDTFVQDKY